MSIARISWHGWPDCFLIQNGIVEAVIVPSIGRVMQLRLVSYTHLSAWLRRSKVMTGAEWIKTRFGTGPGAQLSHLIVVIYAFVSIIGFFSYCLLYTSRCV